MKCNAYMAASWGNQWSLGGRHKLRHAQHDTASSSSWLAPNLLEEEDPPCPVCFFSKSHSSSPEWLNTDWMGSRGGSWSKFSIKLVSYCLWIRSPTGADRATPISFWRRPQFDFSWCRGCSDLCSVWANRRSHIPSAFSVLWFQVGHCGSKLLQVSNLSDNVSEGSKSGMINWGTRKLGRFPAFLGSPGKQIRPIRLKILLFLLK